MIDNESQHHATNLLSTCTTKIKTALYSQHAYNINKFSSEK